MKKLALYCISVISVFLSLLEQSVAVEPNDGNISTEIKILLSQEPDIPSHQISVITDDGVVSLDGKVETKLQSDKIIKLANSVEQVKHVDSSKLQVVSSKQYIKDAFITAAAKGKILQLTKLGKISKNHELHVETTNGRIHVFGSIGSKKDIDLISEELLNIKGVKDVKHNIK